MTRSTGSLALTLALLLAAPAAGATSDPCAAPPGTAAVDQYCESTPGGAASSPSAGQRGHGEPATPVPSATADQVRQHAGGAAVLDRLPGGGTASGSSGGGQKDAGGAAGSGAGQSESSIGTDRAEPAAPGALSGIGTSADSIWSGNMGGIIAILALTLLAGVAFSLRRRSRAGV
jgi:hypothetical protein